ncbi:MAG: hypothetical protein GOVbin1573_49 [Prokaryotic dsDNA virus sp.]|nr:MAG: hypothetical protein GOVbin1573_49 [Prokaryotic dsDNA virus sp.]|tara:strand:+ start:2664 stop:3242 length:579 start_codon:yes stop_codon:yes gene_type:complete
MANVDNPNGLTPLRYLNGSPYNGATVLCYVGTGDSTAIYPGGLVKLAGSSDADGVPAVTGNVSTGDGVYGVVQSVLPVTADSLPYRAASTARYLHVIPAELVEFGVQDDGTGTPATTTAGSVADLTGLTSGNTTFGRSTIEISGSTITAAGDGTEDVVLLGLHRVTGNSLGDNAVWRVKLNNIQLVPDFTGV